MLFELRWNGTGIIMPDNITGAKVLPRHRLRHVHVKLFATEDVQECCIILLTEVRADIAGLYELYQCIARLIALPKMLDERFSICFHVDCFDQGPTEERDALFIANQVRRTPAQIQCQDVSPSHYCRTNKI